MVLIVLGFRGLGLGILERGPELWVKLTETESVSFRSWVFSPGTHSYFIPPLECGFTAKNESGEAIIRSIIPSSVGLFHNPEGSHKRNKTNLRPRARKRVFPSKKETRWCRSAV